MAKEIVTETGRVFMKDKKGRTVERKNGGWHPVDEKQLQEDFKYDRPMEYSRMKMFKKDKKFAEMMYDGKG